MPARETRDAILIADSRGVQARDTRAAVLMADSRGLSAFETRHAVLIAMDPLDTISARFDVVTSITGTLTSVDPEPRITAGQRAALQATRAVHWLFVSVKDADGAWVDLSSVSGTDYVLSATITEQLEQPATAATVTVRAGKDAASIAPMMTDATANTDGRLLDVARDIRIQMAVTDGTTPGGSDIVTVFLGSIDRVSATDGQTLVLSCRDKLAAVLDASFDRKRTYGDGTTPLEAVLQQMLTDCMGSAAPVLITRESPAWAPPGGTYAVTAKRGDSLWAKMTELLDQIGWLVRYRWNGPHVSELSLFEPQRTDTTPLYTLLPFEVQAVQEAALDVSAVRNSIQIAYFPASSSTQAYYTATSSDSITAYKLRPMIVSEDKSSQIDSGAKAARMGQAILSDLEVPAFTHSVTTTHGFWPAQAGDVLSIPANDVTHDATQTLAVTAVTLTLANGGGSATLQMRGKPASKGKAWLRLAGTSNDPAASTGTPVTFTSLTITNTGTSSTGGNLVASWTATGLPSGGYYGVSVSGAGTIATGELVPRTSPAVIGNPVYTDGIAPPSGKVSDACGITVTAYNAAGDVLATRSTVAFFFGIV